MEAIPAARPVLFQVPDEPPKTEAEQRKEAFVARVMEIRNKPVANVVLAPATPRQLNQTQLEMAAGQRAVARHQQQEAARPRPVVKPDPTQGTTTPVFRPADYVPDQRKGQGHVKAQTIAG